MSDYQILIIGAGNAGISTASKLLLKDSKLKIGIIDPSEKHYYQPAWTLVGGGTFDIQATVRDQASVIPDKATWIKDSVTTFNPEQNSVTCASGAKYTYDFLIVAPGIQFDFDKVKGLKETLGKNGVTSNYFFKHAPYTFECLEKFPKRREGHFHQPEHADPLRRGAPEDPVPGRRLPSQERLSQGFRSSLLLRRHHHLRGEEIRPNADQRLCSGTASKPTFTTTWQKSTGPTRSPG